MKSFAIAICMIMVAQSRQSGHSHSSHSSQSSLKTQGVPVGGSTAFGQSTSNSRFGAASPSASSSRFGGSSAAAASSGFGQSTGSTFGFGQSSSSGFGANPVSDPVPPAAPGSASMDRPTFEQPAAPQSPQSPQVPQQPQAPVAPQEPVVGSGPMVCMSADANRISMAKCPMADAQNKCVNMPNCVWGLDANAAPRIGVEANAEMDEEPLVALSASGVDGECLWDMDGALDSVDTADGERDLVAATVAERQQKICASFDEVECAAAAKGMKDALCFWAPKKAQNRILDDVHRAVVTAMNTKVSALDLLLGVAFLITAAFGMHQFQQWWRTRAHSKSGMAAKAEWQDQGMQIPIF